MFCRFLSVSAATLAACAGLAHAQTPNVISNVTGTSISSDGNTVYGSIGRPVKTVIGASGGSGTLTRSTLGPASDGGGGTLVASSTGAVLAFDGYAIGANAGGLSEDTNWVKISIDNGMTWTPMPLLPTQNTCGSDGGGVYDISPNGQYVVGLFYTDSICRNSGFIFDRATNTVTRLSDVAPYGSSATGLPELSSFDMATPRPSFVANSVSADGAVVVGSGQGNSSTPVVWDRDAMGVYHVTRLTSSPGVGGSQRMYVSRDGSTIVGVTNDLATGGAKWTKVGGVWTAAPVPLNTTQVAANSNRPTSWLNYDPLGQTITPTAISADGSVIAGTIRYDSGSFFGSVQAAFIWTSATGTVDLYDYLYALSPFSGLQAYQPGEISGVSLVMRDNTPAQNLILATTGSGFGGPPPAIVKFEPAALCYTPTFFGSLSDQEISSCNTSIFLNPGNASGTGPFDYQWYKDDSPVILGPTLWGSNITAFGASLNIQVAQTPDSGQYHCVATGSGSGICVPAQTGSTNTMTLSTIASPVANDVCLSAANIGALPYTAPGWDVCHAPLNNIIGASCVSTSIADVWFKYTPPADQTVRVSMCGNNFNSLLTVYTAGAGTSDLNCTDTEIACNDSDPSFNCPVYNFGVATIARLDLAGGQTYLFRAASTYLDRFEAYNPGVFTLELAGPAASNDDCSSATEISPATLPVNALVNNLNATNDGVQTACSPEAGRDVWFKFTPDVTQDYRLSTCGGDADNPFQNAPFDTVLSIYAACSGMEIACNDDQGQGWPSQCGGSATSRIDRVTLASGTTYYIRVAATLPNLGDAYGGAADANLNISVAPPFPANDQCANAQVISAVGPAPYVVNDVNNGEAGTDPDSGAECLFDSTRDIWYAFTPPSTPAHGWRIQLCGQSWNAGLSVHSACVGTAANTVACNDDVGSFAPPIPSECDYNGSRIDRVTLTQGTTYYIRVASVYQWGGVSGTITIAPAPAAAANDICANAAPAQVGSTGYDLTEATPQNLSVEVSCTTDDFFSAPYTSSDVWFTFNPPCTTTYSFLVCGGYFDPNIDPVLHLYSNCAAYPDTPLACSDNISAPYPIPPCGDFADSPTAWIRGYPLTAGVPVRIRLAVASYNLNGPNRAGSPEGNLYITQHGGCESCCRGTTCQIVAPGSCTGVVAGSNSVSVGTCTGNTNAGCCFGDYDHNGTKDITDIFTFLNAWFSASTYADITSNGDNTPDITDIFTFLNAWFGTCS